MAMVHLLVLIKLAVFNAILVIMSMIKRAKPTVTRIVAVMARHAEHHPMESHFVIPKMEHVILPVMNGIINMMVVVSAIVQTIVDLMAQNVDLDRIVVLSIIMALLVVLNVLVLAAGLCNNV